MGINVTCDCCGEEVLNVTEVGFVKKTYYGDCCIEKYREYEKDFDLLHTRIAEQTKSEIEALRDNWIKKHGGKLPD